MDFDMNAANIAMLKNYVKEARSMEEMFSVKGKVAIVTGATSAWVLILRCGCCRAALGL